MQPLLLSPALKGGLGRWGAGGLGSSRLGDGLLWWVHGGVSSPRASHPAVPKVCVVFSQLPPPGDVCRHRFDRHRGVAELINLTANEDLV